MSNQPLSNLPRRLITAAVGIPLLLLVFFMLDERVIFVLLAGLLAALLWECAQLALTAGRLARTLYCVAGILLYVIVIEFANPFAITDSQATAVGSGSMLIFYVAYFCVPTVLIAKQAQRLVPEGSEKEGAVSVSSGERYLHAVMWLLLCTGMCIVVFEMFRSHGPELLITLLAIAWATDTGAYFIGRAIGKRRIAKSISPNKTIAGTVGGYWVGVVVGLILGFVWLMDSLQWSLVHVVIAALTLPWIAIVGDLLESIFKRRFGAKESGGMLPGHGGLLDRLDSVVLTSGAMALIAFY